MSVSTRVREVEKEIDAEIRALKIWRRSKVSVLGDLMRTYRDAIELVFLELDFLELHSESLETTSADVTALLIQENRIRAGTLWALKWASEFCPVDGANASSSDKELVDILTLGATYESFVDALKYANHDLASVEIDEQSRTILCYEGKQSTTNDLSIVDHQRGTVPKTYHVSLTEDEDQITSRWAAGDYRRVIRNLAIHAASMENAIEVDPAYLADLGKAAAPLPQPTVVWLDRPSQSPDCHVFDDFVLPIDDAPQLKWKLVALLDNPVVKVGQRYCALSSDLKALSTIDDYMLRLAARVDVVQYTTAANLRENRMISRCKDALERSTPPWHVREQVRYSAPTQEADILAARGTDVLILELKSTLRPETPWEVYKRNKDIIFGIKQAKALIDRGVATNAVVVTDGYRGDYACWAEALSNGIPIGNLYDLSEIAENPEAAALGLKAKVGVTTGSLPSGEALPDREVPLFGWKLRLIDTEAPQD